jgi:hypothetical protein
MESSNRKMDVKIETNHKKMEAKLKANNEKMEGRVGTNNGKFEVLRDTLVSQMDIHQARTESTQEEIKI